MNQTIVKHLSFITLVTSVVRKQNSSTAPSTDQNLFSTVYILFPYLIFVLLFQGLISAWFGKKCDYNLLTHCDTGGKNTETAKKDGTWLREISSCCCLTTAGKTRQLLLNKIYILSLSSL